MNCRLVLVLPLMLLCVPSGADGITDADCTKPQHAQMIINHCSGLQFREADKQLTAVYERTLAALTDPAARDRLKEAEDAFVKNRAETCAAQSHIQSHGSIHSMQYTVCARELTEARSRALQAHLVCLNGGGKCDN